MNEHDWLAERFEASSRSCVRWRTGCSARSARPTTPSRKPGCASAAPTPSDIENLGGWLTTVVARVCLDMLRSRGAARGAARAGGCPTCSSTGPTASTPSTRRCWPIRSAWRCSSCSRRCPRRSGSRSCCTTCSPCPSTRSPRSWSARPAAARQLASRARRRVQGADTVPDTDLAAQREVVDAFLAAARDGDFDGSSRCSTRMSCAGRFRAGPRAGGGARRRGSRGPGARLRPARAGRAAGADQRRCRSGRDPRRAAVLGRAVTVRDGKIVEIDFLADPERLRRARPDDPRLTRVDGLVRQPAPSNTRLIVSTCSSASVLLPRKPSKRARRASAARPCSSSR